MLLPGCIRLCSTSITIILLGLGINELRGNNREIELMGVFCDKWEMYVYLQNQMWSHWNVLNSEQMFYMNNTLAQKRSLSSHYIWQTHHPKEQTFIEIQCDEFRTKRKLCFFSERIKEDLWSQNKYTPIINVNKRWDLVKLSNAFSSTPGHLSISDGWNVLTVFVCLVWTHLNQK